LMVFVPVSTLNQQKKSMAFEASIQAKLNDDTFMTAQLGEWYDNAAAGKDGSQNFCDINYLNKNGLDRAKFVAIRFDENFTSKKAVLNFIGAESFYYNDVEVTDLSAVEPLSGKTYQEIKDGNANYKKFVASGMNNYKSDQVFANVTKNGGQKSLAVYMVILLAVLIAMATFRSPAVALMPDVTPKPLRSQANAVINLMGGLGGAISFLIYTVVLFGTNLHNYVIIFASVGAGMLLVLAGFLALVNERKMVKRCQEICEEYGITDDDENLEKPLETVETNAETNALDGIAMQNEAATLEIDSKPSSELLELAKQKLHKIRSPKEWWGAKTKLEKSKFTSFMLILASIFMWFMGYNAISSNLSIYITKELNLSAGIASIINGVSMAVSAIAFIPVGYLAAKVGRKKTIIIGYVLAIISFVLVASFVKAGDNAAIPAALFALFYLIAGFGLIITNVNTFPMVVELADAKDVGQYTGYYYIATMSAQAITPAFAGLVMEHIANKSL
ncbi:MAG: MFS transporter, partial [Clostridia bacterium]